MLLATLLTTGAAASGPPSAGASSGKRDLVWLCRPGQSANPCSYSLAATAVTTKGALESAVWPHSANAAKFDCFYVHPTDSLSSSANTGVALTQLEIGVAVEQAAPFSQVCHVWAPSYRSQTLSSVEKGLAGDEAVMRSTFTVAYESVLAAWRSFLAHSDGKPFVLIGDSQGAAILIHLISAQLDHQPSVLGRLVVAVIVGGNLQVPSGQTVGATFTRVPLCTRATQTGCAIAFSSYPSEPPADSLFGRPGQGTSLQSAQTATDGQQVACVNPAALAGGTADLDPFVLTATQVGPSAGLDIALSQPVATPWVTYPDLYSARCESRGGATWLQVTSLEGSSRVRPVVTEKVVGTEGAGTGPRWGYHSYEFGLTLGNLLHDVAREEAAWVSSH